MLFAAMLLWAAPVWAAKVVDVRVGQHADFDRIVFDLDGFAAYQVRSISKDEIVVTIMATSQSRDITLDKGLVRSVRMTPVAQGAEIRIRVSESRVQVKDMMLQSPARIVIDLRRPEATAASAAKPAPVVKPAPVAKPAPVVTPKETAIPPATAKSEPVIAVTEAKPEAVAEALTTTPPPIPAESSPEVPVAAPESNVEKAQPPLVAREVAQGTKLESMAGAPSKTVEPPRGVPRRVVNTRAPAPAPAPEGSAYTFGDVRTLGAGGLVLLVGVVGLLWWRRRGKAPVAEGAAEIEGDWFAMDSGDSEELPIPIEDSEATLPVSSQKAWDAAPTTEDIKFDEEASEEELGKHAMPSPQKREEPAAHATPIGVIGGAAPSVPLEQYQRLEERLAKLESRLSEMEEARERLEQQGVNQTEELRVQRAAIARTQRVIRDLTRPQDEAATEPVPKE